MDRIAIDPKRILSDKFAVEHHENLLGGVSILRGAANVVDERGWEGALYRHNMPASENMDITAIPYYAWDNRAPGEMRVWVRAIS